MKNFSIQFKKLPAFTLVEVLVAIFVLIVGAGAVFSLISQTLGSTSLLKEKFIATYLAQEAVEIVKNIRDSNWLAGRNWREGLSAGERQVDYNDLTLSSFNGNYLNIEANDFYGYGAGFPTKFVRKITLSNLDNNRIKVEVEVSWQERGKRHSFVLKSILTNWFNP